MGFPGSLLIEELHLKNAAGMIENLENVRKQIAPVLGRISDFFDDYTNHDVSHSDQVLSNLD